MVISPTSIYVWASGINGRMAATKNEPIGSDEHAIALKMLPTLPIYSSGVTDNIVTWTAIPIIELTKPNANKSKPYSMYLNRGFPAVPININPRYTPPIKEPPNIKINLLVIYLLKTAKNAEPKISPIVIKLLPTDKALTPSFKHSFT